MVMTQRSATDCNLPPPSTVELLIVSQTMPVETGLNFATYQVDAPEVILTREREAKLIFQAPPLRIVWVSGNSRAYSRFAPSPAVVTTSLQTNKRLDRNLDWRYTKYPHY